MARKENEKVGIVNCLGVGANQIFSYTANKEIRIDDPCLDFSKLNGPVTRLKCHPVKCNQLWEYEMIGGLSHLMAKGLQKARSQEPAELFLCPLPAQPPLADVRQYSSWGTGCLHV